jgi:2-polyprenyl-3-methyl-5-hydroxy-6-metoxy-1,4-benzoquinol methylase
LKESATDTPFSPRELEWTLADVRRFWSYLAQSAHAERAYFSSHSGDPLIAFVRARVPLAPGQRLLDFGCGPGFLVERLAARGLTTEGLEFSADSCAQTVERCKQYETFRGATFAEALPSPLPAASFECIFLVEVIEHLLPEHIDSTFREIYRLLKPGGYVVVTTPHDEDLQAARTMCPGCGLIFHPWQHVGTFTVRTLAATLSGYGFTQRYCRATMIGAGRGAGLMRILRRLAGRVVFLPHLIYIGRKP